MTERLFLDLPGGRFAALAAGPADGPLAVCLHGFPDLPATFVESGLLDALAAAGVRAVAPWLRGYAPSPLAGPYHADRLALDLVEMVDALSPGRPAFAVGHDWGAVAVYVAASRFPGRFSRVVTMAVPHPLAFLANAARDPAQLRRSSYMAWFQLPAIPERGLRGGGRAQVDALWRRWSPGWSPPAAHLDQVAACLTRSLPGPLAHYRAMVRPPVEAWRRVRDAGSPERRIAVPTLHLQGARDGCISVAMRRGQGRHFADGVLAEGIVPGAGHFLHLERPDAVEARILGWLGLGPAGAGPSSPPLPD